MCVKNSLFDLIFGNARKPNDPKPALVLVAATVIRAQALDRRDLKPLEALEVTTKMTVDKEDVIRLQEKDSTMQIFCETKRIESKNKFMILCEKCGEIWYRMRQRKDDVRDTRKQILMHKFLIVNVMKVVDDFLFEGH